jgi:hypothetical protein
VGAALMAGDGWTMQLSAQAKDDFIMELLQALHKHHQSEHGFVPENWPLVCHICGWKVREDEQQQDISGKPEVSP